MDYKDYVEKLLQASEKAIIKNPQDKFDIAIGVSHVISELAAEALEQNANWDWHKTALARLKEAVK